MSYDLDRNNGRTREPSDKEKELMEKFGDKIIPASHMETRFNTVTQPSPPATRPKVNPGVGMPDRDLRIIDRDDWSNT